MLELHSYQEAPMPALETLVRANKPLVLLAASTGYGKTVMALELMKRANRPFGVLAPRVTLSAWAKTAAAMGLSSKFTYNVEKLRTGRQPKVLEKKSNYVWTWTGLEPGDWLIVDEIHRHGGLESQNAYMVANAKARGINVLGLSATLADSPLKLRLLLHLSELVSWKNFYSWAREHGCFRDPAINGHPWRFVKGRRATEIMAGINAQLFPAFGVRLRSEDVPGFPKVQNIVDPVTPSDAARKATQAAYASLAEELKNPDASKHEMVRMLRWRQRIEAEKLPVLKELVEESLEEGMSVVVSFNFTAPLFQFADEMKAHAPALVYGSDPQGRTQTPAERDAHVARFQSNETRLCALSIDAGGVGLSLGDEHGGHPRIAYHNLPLTSVGLVQLLGRVHRANSKTPSINRIVLLDGVPIEERVFRILSGKISNMSALQDDDLDLSKLIE
mgnify:FL=1